MKKIDYNNLKCRVCSNPVPRPKHRLSSKVVSLLICSQCKTAKRLDHQIFKCRECGVPMPKPNWVQCKAQAARCICETCRAKHHIDYNNLKCKRCGNPVSRPNYRLSLKNAANLLCPSCHPRIDYNNLKCRDCGVTLPRPKRPRTFASLPKMQCSNCRANSSRTFGRIPMEKNAKIQITPEMKQVIIGSVLGDGCLERPPVVGINWCLGVKHSLTQKQYALHKACLLKPLISCVDYPKERVRFRTVHHPYLTQLAKTIIPRRRKTVPLELAQSIEALALAIWYLDDGNYTPRRIDKKGRCKDMCLRLCSFSFNAKENSTLRKTLKTKFGLRSKPFYQRNPRKPQTFYEGISLYGKEAQKLLTIVKPYVLGTGMEYKVGLVSSPAE